MKKNYRFRFLALVAILLLGVVVVSCNKDKDELTEEQIRIVLANAEVVMDNVSQIYKASETVEEMAQHLDEIKAMANVEDAWREESTICVKIIDGGIITYSLYPRDEMNYTTICEKLPVIKNANTTHNKGKRACVVVQWIYDDGMGDSYSRTSQIASELNRRGYSCEFVLGEQFTTDFICDSLPNYDVVLLLTHGDYVNGQHWITTGESYGSFMANLYHAYYRLWKDDLMQIGTPQKEMRNGELSEYYYLRLSEKYLQKNISKNFPNNSLMFAISCKLLEGNQSMWEILREKNLGCFFGYDDNIHAGIGCNALESVMNSMLNRGATASEAYQAVPANGRHDNYTGANLVLCPANSNITLVETDPEGNDWVDLGLPSGLLWATRNVGATSPEDYGDYFAWGETSPKSVYNWNTYRYCNGGRDQLTKYCSLSMYGYGHGDDWYTVGFRDTLTILQPNDDAATVRYGGRTPTQKEWRELIDNTTSQRTTLNGVDGILYSSANGNSMFLPFAGFYEDNRILHMGLTGKYWTSSLSTGNPPDAELVWIGLDIDAWLTRSDRCDGLTVRAVL